MSHKINVNQLANALVLEMRKQLEMPEAFRALLVDQKRRDKEHLDDGICSPSRNCWKGHTNSNNMKPAQNNTEAKKWHQRSHGLAPVCSRTEKQVQKNTKNRVHEERRVMENDANGKLASNEKKVARQGKTEHKKSTMKDLPISGHKNTTDEPLSSKPVKPSTAGKVIYSPNKTTDGVPTSKLTARVHFAPNAGSIAGALPQSASPSFASRRLDLFPGEYFLSQGQYQPVSSHHGHPTMAHHPAYPHYNVPLLLVPCYYPYESLNPWVHPLPNYSRNPEAAPIGDIRWTPQNWAPYGGSGYHPNPPPITGVQPPQSSDTTQPRPTSIYQPPTVQSVSDSDHNSSDPKNQNANIIGGEDIEAVRQ